MPRTLILMRHAKQSTYEARDHDRPLTHEGREAARVVGETFVREGFVLDAALASTAKRCRETWECVSSAFEATAAASFDDSLYNASAQGLLEGLAAMDDAAQTLLLVAHNPGISLLAFELAGSDENATEILRTGFSPATTARFEIDGAWSTVSPRTARFLRFDPT